METNIKRYNLDSNIRHSLSDRLLQHKLKPHQNRHSLSPQIHKLDDTIDELKRLNTCLNEENTSLQLAHETAKKEIEMLEQDQEQSTDDLQNLRAHLATTSESGGRMLVLVF